MKLEHNPNGEIIRDGVGERHSFGIESPALIMETLSGLYSNAKRIICQEYMSNARDAHREVGKNNTPIDVTLPTIIDPNLKIRDYGPSICPDRVKNVFTIFGASTKRGTNNETGGFGIGAKCAFAYTNAFMVTSITPEENGNVKRVYSVAKDEGGIPEMATLIVQDTDEPAGTEISIPIDNYDFNGIKNYVTQITEYWDVRPNVTNCDLDYEDEEPVRTGKGWKLYSVNNFHGSYAMPFVVMDGIRYPLNVNDIPIDDNYRRMLSTKIGLFFKTGEIRPAHNRESLKYTDDVKKTISKRLEDTFKQIEKDVTKEITSAPNLWDANIIFNQLVKTNGCRGLIKKVSWNGHTIDGRHVAAPDDSYVYVYHRSDYEAENRLKGYRLDHLMFDEESIVIYNDETDSLRPSPLRVKTIFDTEDYETIQVIQINNADALQEWKKAGFDDLETTPISNYEKKKIKRKASKNVVHSCYKLTGSRFQSHNINLSEDEGIYVETYRNSPLNSIINNITELNNIRSHFKIEILGIPSRFIKEVKKNSKMVHLDKFLEDKYQELLGGCDVNMEEFALWNDYDHAYSNNSMYKGAYAPKFIEEYANHVPDDHFVHEWIRLSKIATSFKVTDELKTVQRLAQYLHKDNPFQIQKKTDLSKYKGEWTNLVKKIKFITKILDAPWNSEEYADLAKILRARELGEI